MPASLEALTVNTPNRDAIFNAKSVAVFVAPMTVAMPTALTTGGTSAPTVPVTLSELTGFEPIGLLRKDDAVGRSRDRETSTVEAVGYDDPVREDVTTDAMSAKIVCLETRKSTIEKFLNIDLSGVTPNANTGEVSFPHVTVGKLTPYRWLFIGQDGTALDRSWIGWGFAAGIVSEVDDQTLGGTDDPWMWPMTIKSQLDTTLGYGVRSYFSGPGWKSRLTALGFGS
jgi:hypothetical protein